MDVLQIMRNIHVFVARYNYNLNQLLFVEKKAVKGAKALNTVSIKYGEESRWPASLARPCGCRRG